MLSAMPRRRATICSVRSSTTACLSSQKPHQVTPDYFCRLRERIVAVDTMPVSDLFKSTVWRKYVVRQIVCAILAVMFCVICFYHVLTSSFKEILAQIKTLVSDYEKFS